MLHLLLYLIFQKYDNSQLFIRIGFEEFINIYEVVYKKVIDNNNCICYNHCGYYSEFFNL